MTQQLLKALVSIPSPSREEKAKADYLEAFLSSRGADVHREGNNLWCIKGSGPALLMDAHIDTVKSVSGWASDPNTPVVIEGRLHGLGSSDDGGCVAAMTKAFLEARPEGYSLVLSLSAEEEISGKGGLEKALRHIKADIRAGIIGEPTSLRMAVCERGLMVLDCMVRGKAGHAARQEGDNAIYKALADIEWFRRQPGMQVTIIGAGTQHNVVPDLCTFTVDVRTEGSNEDALEHIKSHVGAEVRPRSMRLNGSAIGLYHPLVRAGVAIGLETFSSPTLSNQALCPFPTIKLGPGDSALSHTAEESIDLEEVERAADIYLKLMEEYGKNLG